MCKFLCYKKPHKSLKDVNTDDIPIFNFNNKTIKCKVADIVDGDTIHVVFRLDNEFVKYRVRLARINCPEIRTKNKHEKERGLQAKAYLTDLIDKKIVTLRCFPFDKYGRLLADVYYNNKCVNDELVDNRLAIYYHSRKNNKTNINTEQPTVSFLEQ